MFSKRNILTFLSLSALLAVIFSYGVAVGRFKVFPYSELKSLYSTSIESVADETFAEAGGSQKDPLSLETELLKLRGHKYSSGEKLSTYGAALSRMGPELIGVDGAGTFFHYRSEGDFSTLGISLEMNRDSFLTYIDENDIESGPNKQFRILDIAAKVGDKTQLFVSHHYWHPQEHTKTVRVSRLRVEEPRAILGGDRISKDEWKVIFESTPPQDYDGPPYFHMFTNHIGGRLALDSGNNLLLSLGDYMFDGRNRSHIASQDDTSSYGKVIQIDLKTLRASHFAKGMRNPEGLHVDGQGRIWQTEHGPCGGDELNLVKKDANYGWPLVTYGKRVDCSYTWTYSDTLSNHIGYKQPYYVWKPNTGISNLIQVQDFHLRWNGDLLVSSLAGLSLYRMRVREGRVTRSERIPVGSRIRDIEQMNDGTLVLITHFSDFVEIQTTQSDANILGSKD